jgi:hypothetical protein
MASNIRVRKRIVADYLVGLFCEDSIAYPKPLSYIGLPNNVGLVPKNITCLPGRIYNSGSAYLHGT